MCTKCLGNKIVRATNPQFCVSKNFENPKIPNPAVIGVIHHQTEPSQRRESTHVVTNHEALCYYCATTNDLPYCLLYLVQLDSIIGYDRQIAWNESGKIMCENVTILVTDLYDFEVCYICTVLYEYRPLPNSSNKTFLLS